MKIGSRTVSISSRDKIYFPDARLTKGDVIEYYERIADRMLPFLRDRPLSLRRFPNGIAKPGFFQKRAGDYFPDWIETVAIEQKEGEPLQQVICNDLATLIYLANQGVIEFHPWLSQKGQIRRPDRMIFDLDPPEGEFETVRRAARTLRECLTKRYGLQPRVMTTGSKGLHVVCAIQPDLAFEEVRSVSEGIADYLADRHPEIYTTETRKKKRKGRLFLDFMRNSYAQTAIAPYSVRARPGATVAMPVEWSELTRTTPDRYHIKNAFRRLARKEAWETVEQGKIERERVPQSA